LIGSTPKWKSASPTWGSGTTATNDEVHAGIYTFSTSSFVLVTESAAGTAADLTGPVVHFIAKFVKYGLQA
jgi:hypothetical protein